MHRTRCALFLSLMIAGCQLPPERVPIMPLPAEGQTLPYAEALAKARAWASAANAAFYEDRWPELQEIATGLEKTAQLLPKSPDLPAKQKEPVTAHTAKLVKEIGLLRAAIETKDVTATNRALQRINLNIRELRPD